MIIRIQFLLSIIIWAFSSNLVARPFIVGELHGQLGNQLFEVAATVSLALDYNAKPLFPDFRNKTKDNISLNYKKVFWRLNSDVPKRKIRFHYKEHHYHYKPITYHPDMNLFGFFQSEKYFRHHKDEILALFEPSDEIVSYLNKKYGDIIRHPNTVSIHVRTYYFQSLAAFAFNGVDYVEKAIALFPEDTLFIVFSDMISWCEENLKHIPRNIRFIKGEAHYHDLYLMSMCKHNVISNSSFSWWAAYLNKNPSKIVIAPSRWFQPGVGDSTDIIPSDWITIQ